jgi:hypothetical protein
MSQIQRSTSAGPLSAADADTRLRNAPEWFRDRVSAAREVRGLAPLPARKQARVAPPRRRPPAAGAAPAAITPRSTPAAPPRPLPKVGIVLVGLGAGEPKAGLVETFATNALDNWLSRAQHDPRGSGFVLRAAGHNSPAIADAADGSITFRSVGGSAVAVWTPDPSNPAHRAAVASIASGVDAVSVEVQVVRAEFHAGARVILEAEPVGAAILRAGETPAYRTACCGILPSNQNEVVALVRLAAASVRRA